MIWTLNHACGRWLRAFFLTPVWTRVRDIQQRHSLKLAPNQHSENKSKESFYRAYYTRRLGRPLPRTIEEQATDWAQLLRSFRKYAGKNADEECVEKRYKTLEKRGGLLSPLEKWITSILEKKFLIYLGRLCLRSLFHKVNKGLYSRWRSGATLDKGNSRGFKEHPPYPSPRKLEHLGIEIRHSHTPSYRTRKLVFAPAC